MQEPIRPFPLPEAPGAQASRTCGLLAIILGIVLGPFCIGIPIAIVLGIVAIVKSGKAKRMVAQHPESFAPHTSSGLVMGIVGLAVPVLILPVIGIISAIAIPALLSQRARARDKAVISNLTGHFADLAGQYDRLKDGNKTNAEIKAGLETYLQETCGNDKNPWNVNQPAFSYTVAVVEGITPETTRVEGNLQPAAMGQCVYAIQFRTKDHPGYLAGSVQITNKVNESNFIFKKMELD